MKTALYYAIRRNLYNTVVAVTTEKGSRRWHGRDCTYNEATHGTFDQLMGRFDTKEAAEAMRTEIARIANKYKAERKPHETAIMQLHQSERQAIEEAVNS